MDTEDKSGLRRRRKRWMDLKFDLFRKEENSNEILNGIRRKEEIMLIAVKTLMLRRNYRFQNMLTWNRKECIKSSACYLLHAEFLRGLFFHPEDGGDMFLRNVCCLAMEYTALCPRSQNSA
jgi:hypothetical protein